MNVEETLEIIGEPGAQWRLNGAVYVTNEPSDISVVQNEVSRLSTIQINAYPLGCGKRRRNGKVKIREGAKVDRIY